MVFRLWVGVTVSSVRDKIETKKERERKQRIDFYYYSKRLGTFRDNTFPIQIYVRTTAVTWKEAV